MSEGLQAIAVIRVSVKPVLQKAQGCRTFGENLAAPVSRFFVQALARDDLIDQPHGSRLLSIVLVTQIPDLASLFLSHDTRQVRGAKARIKTPHLWTGLAENGAI